MLAGVVKREEELDSKAILVENGHQCVFGDNNRNFNANNNNNKGISIAERRAVTRGFNASNINSTDWFITTAVTAASQPIKSPYFTVPPGISPSALLDSPVMLPNDQGQLSPTTGTFQFTSPNLDSFKLKQKFPLVQGFTHPFSKDLRGGNETNQLLTSHNNGKEKSKNPNREKQQKGTPLPKEAAKYSEDGYYWRKYGQKQVKGSEYPRSYFKCTNMNCLVKKKVERSYDGEITEIVYKGSHNHHQPQPLKQFEDASEINGGTCVKADDESVTEFGTFSTSFVSDFSNPLSKAIEPVEAQEFSPNFGSQEGDNKDEASRESISFNGGDDADGECEPKRRKRNSFPNETSTISKSNREPRVVVQIESEIDILDDGYRWRKYGQKVVKGNPNPRSYYKCTTPGCPVRKHVERAPNDIRSVITTYEGKHNHEVPCSKNSTFVISDIANLPSNVTSNTTLSTSTTQKPIHLPKTGKESQNLPFYSQQRPILNYNEFMRSNLPHGHDLNFGASSIYPLSLPPPFPYGLNGNQMKTFPMSNLYPVLPDYMPTPSQINHVSFSGNVPSLMNNYQANQPSLRGQEVYKEYQPKLQNGKQEQRNDI